MLAQEKVEAVKSTGSKKWIGKYYVGELDDKNEEIVYYADKRRDTCEDAIEDAMKMMSDHKYNMSHAKELYEIDGF